LLEHVQVTDAIDRFLCEEGMSNIFTNEHSAQASTLGLAILYVWLFGVGLCCQNSQLWMYSTPYVLNIVLSWNVTVSRNHESLW
jgi:hypothetical protein